MRKQDVKRVFAAILGLSMMAGMTAYADEADANTAEVDAPIYALDVLDVVVPTTYAVAFNPGGLSITKGSTAVTDQIISKNYGIVNKSTKDKLVTVSLTVDGQNDDKITFTDASGVTNAAAGEYKINLKAVPAAAAADVKIGTAAIDKDTTAAELADVAMNEATAGIVDLNAGTTDLAFKLNKATYALKTGETIDLGSTLTPAELQDKFEVSAVDAAGYTAFTLKGTMNTNAEWTKLTEAIKITAVYSSENAASTLSATTGTAGVVDLTALSPAFTTGTAVGTISYTEGTDSFKVKEITSIEMAIDGGKYDGFNAVDGAWSAATVSEADTNGNITITFDASYMKFYQDAFADDATRTATVTYVTEGGATKTATVEVKLK